MTRIRTTAALTLTGFVLSFVFRSAPTSAPTRNPRSSRRDARPMFTMFGGKAG